MIEQKYNASQLAAIQATEENVAIIAPAGSGKTATLVGAVEHYREEYPYHSIVAITFTRKAAAELQDRIQAKNIEVSTIHSWAYRRLYALGQEYGFKVQLLEEEEIKKILKVLCRRLNYLYLNQFQLYAYIMGNYNIDIDKQAKRMYENVRAHYVAYKQKNQLYDFTDLPKYLLDKLDEYELDIVDVRALFVDEFQDVDEVELELFRRTKTSKKFFIGDPRQAIYGFRGSVQNVFSEIPEFTVYKLDTNYRSYQDILDCAISIRDEANAVIRGHGVYELHTFDKPITHHEITCSRGSQPESVAIIRDIGQCETLTLGEELPKSRSDVLLIKQLITDKRTQILCRTNKEVKKVQSYNIDNVSTIHQAKGLEYDNVIVVSFAMDCDEEMNVGYVAMTRAKNKLCIIPFEVLLYIICQEDITSSRKLF